MKNLISVILFFVLTSNVFGQSDDEIHNQFLKFIMTEKVDSIYNSYLEINENDEQYEDALLFRNEFGWALNEIEQLKTDISSILKLADYSSEMAYQRIFRPQKFPPTEWNRFYEISIELEKLFDVKSIEYRELLAIKTKLEFIAKNDKALSVDLPKLLDCLDKKGKPYSLMLWQYGNLLIRIGEREEAQKVFEEGVALYDKSDFLFSLIKLYTSNKDFDNIIKYKDQILKNSSGILLFNLGEAYLEQNKKSKALEYFSLYISKFKYSDYDPYVKIEEDNTVYHIEPNELETLGDFFVASNMQQSCEFYEYAEKITKESNEERFFKKRLMAVKDENQKKEMISKFEEYKITQDELLIRINSKTKKCK